MLAFHIQDTSCMKVALQMIPPALGLLGKPSLQQKLKYPWGKEELESYNESHIPVNKS